MGPRNCPTARSHVTVLAALAASILSGCGSGRATSAGASTAVPATAAARPVTEAELVAGERKEDQEFAANERKENREQAADERKGAAERKAAEPAPESSNEQTKAAAPTNGDAPAPQTPSATLTVSQVRAAEHGATAILQLCLDESKGEYTGAKINADIDAATEGFYKLQEALRRDPDTHYQEPTFGGGSQPVTMRQLAANVASEAGQGGGCGELAHNLQTALNGLPGG
jgi:hypothetical protein